VLLYNSAVAQWLFQRLAAPIERLGWDKREPRPITIPGGRIPPLHRYQLENEPVLIATHGWPAGTRVDPKPDWAWRFELARDERPDDDSPRARPEAVRPESLAAEFDASNSLAGYRQIARRQTLALRNGNPRVVQFRSNLGLAGFERPGGRLSVVHSLVSVHPAATLPDEPEVYGQQTASLVPTGATPPDIRET
jgi:hypothetical protein